MILKITPKQIKRVNALVRRLCCNCDDGNCLLLDDGEPHSCMQLIGRYGIYCNYFMNAVLPADKELNMEITNAAKGKRCILCSSYFLSRAKNQRYCPKCAEMQRRIKAAERQRRKRAYRHAFNVPNTACYKAFAKRKQGQQYSNTLSLKNAR